MNEKLELEFVGNNAQQYELESSIVRVKPESESIDITPAKESQKFEGLYDTVNVSGDKNLIADNIKKGVEIFEVEGSYEAGKITLPNGIKFKESSNLTDTSFLNDLDFSNVTDGEGMFYMCINMETIPLFDTSHFTSVAAMFGRCSKLKDVPEFSTEGITKTYGFYRTFEGCTNLTNNSLNNILAMCYKCSATLNAKTLKNIGLTQSQAETCMTLSNYQAFLDAGWTTGY